MRQSLVVNKHDFKQKRIKIKGQKDSIYTIKVSKHGPVMNGIVENLEDERPIAMQWIYTKLQNYIMDVFLQCL